MDDELDRPRKEYPLSPAKMSKTPSWVMLGFVLGAVTVASLPPLRKVPPAEPASAPAAPPRREIVMHQPLTTIEAVFEDWAKYAVWEADLTEVALWNKDAGDFTDFYEVLRYASRYYYRPIPALTRRVIRRGKEIPGCPLLFTETEEQYQEWRQHGRSERPLGDYRPLSAFPAAAEPAAKSPEAPKMAPPKFEAIAPFEAPPVRSSEPRK